MQDIIEKDEKEALMRQYMKPKESTYNTSKKNSEAGFVVRGGPWSSSVEDFPTLGGGPVGSAVGGTKWGPSIRGPNIPRDWK